MKFKHYLFILLIAIYFLPIYTVDTCRRKSKHFHRKHKISPLSFDCTAFSRIYQNIHLLEELCFQIETKALRKHDFSREREQLRQNIQQLLHVCKFNRDQAKCDLITTIYRDFEKNLDLDNLNTYNLNCDQNFKNSPNVVAQCHYLENKMLTAKTNDAGVLKDIGVFAAIVENYAASESNPQIKSGLAKMLRVLRVQQKQTPVYTVVYNPYQVSRTVSIPQERPQNIAQGLKKSVVIQPPTPQQVQASKPIADSFKSAWEFQTTISSNDNDLNALADGALDRSYPPDFCWKLSYPKCPPSHPERAGFPSRCYERCEKGYIPSGNECSEDCSKYDFTKDGEKVNYTPNLFLCTAGLKGWWHLRDSKTRKSSPKDDDQLPCPSGEKIPIINICKNPDCPKGYESCWIGCGLNSVECNKAMINIVKDTMLGVLQLTIMVLTGGTAAPVIAALKQIYNVANTWKSFVDSLVNIIKSGLEALVEKLSKIKYTLEKPDLKENVLTKCTFELITSYIKGRLNNAQARDFCNKAIQRKLESLQTDETSKKIKSILNDHKGDIAIILFSLKTIVSGNYKPTQTIFTPFMFLGLIGYHCSNLLSGGLDSECVGGVLQQVSTIDPTGISTLIGAFIYPTCQYTNSYSFKKHHRHH